MHCRGEGTEMTNRETAIYKDRFENAFRVAKKITSCLNIGDILEIIRDEVKITIPHAEQACLILVDPDAPTYTRPLHCAVEKENINCHLCKRGKDIVQRAWNNLPHFGAFRIRLSRSLYLVKTSAKEYVR